MEGKASDLAGDRGDHRRDVAAEQRQRQDRDDPDEGDDHRVLGQCLTAFVADGVSDAHGVSWCTGLCTDGEGWPTVKGASTASRPDLAGHPNKVLANSTKAPGVPCRGPSRAALLRAYVDGGVGQATVYSHAVLGSGPVTRTVTSVEVPEYVIGTVAAPDTEPVSRRVLPS